MKNTDIRELHHIFYIPGLGGNFLTRLFSLSDNTFFLWSQGSCGCRPANMSLEEKVKWYTFKESDQFNWSLDGHLFPHGVGMSHPPIFPNLGHKRITNSHHDINRIHTVDIKNSTFRFDGRPGVVEKYYYVHSDPEFYSFMNRYLKLNKHSDNVFPTGRQWRWQEETLNKGIPISPIYLKTMIDSDEGFLSEYKRVCELMGLTPVADDVALNFFHVWRRLRVDNPNIDG